MGSWSGLPGQMPKNPMALPDLSDEAVRRARAKTLLGESLARGRSSTFSSARGFKPQPTQALGLSAQPPKTLLGM